jgi:putative adenylate-forming enzyme
MSLFQIARSFFYYRYGLKFYSREQLESWQNKQVKRHLAWVKAHSPFYREHWNNHAMQDWKTLAHINKTIMMNNFDKLNTVDMSQSVAMTVALNVEGMGEVAPTLKGVTVGLSSGTSGQRGLFLVSNSERYHWAGAILAKMLPNILTQPERIALFLRSNSSLYTSVASKRVTFHYFGLDGEREAMLEQLTRYQPTVLLAPPSMLRLLGQNLEQGQLTITPRQVISVAEVLEPLDEHIITRQFGQNVQQIYQCTEGFLGYTCAHGTLHLNEDLVCIQKEYLGESKGKFIPIITDFRRMTQPIIRYRLGDILTQRKTSCPCGSVLTALESIEGREEDMFLLRALDGASCKMFPDTLRQALRFTEHDLHHYQIRQLSTDHIEVLLEPSTMHTRECVKTELNRLWQTLNLRPVTFTFASFTFQVSSKKMKHLENVMSETDKLSLLPDKDPGYTRFV